MIHMHVREWKRIVCFLGPFFTHLPARSESCPGQSAKRQRKQGWLCRANLLGQSALVIVLRVSRWSKKKEQVSSSSLRALFSSSSLPLFLSFSLSLSLSLSFPLSLLSLTRACHTSWRRDNYRRWTRQSGRLARRAVSAPSAAS